DDTAADGDPEPVARLLGMLVFPRTTLPALARRLLHRGGWRRRPRGLTQLLQLPPRLLRQTDDLDQLLLRLAELLQAFRLTAHLQERFAVARLAGPGGRPVPPAGV